MAFNHLQEKRVLYYNCHIHDFPASLNKRIGTLTYYQGSILCTFPKNMPLFMTLWFCRKSDTLIFPVPHIRSCQIIIIIIVKSKMTNHIANPIQSMRIIIVNNKEDCPPPSRSLCLRTEYITMKNHELNKLGCSHCVSLHSPNGRAMQR